MHVSDKHDRADRGGVGVSHSHLPHFDTFLQELEVRLEKGRKEYGDATLDRPLAEIIDEMKQEFLDVVGWGYFGWLRLCELEAAAQSVKEKAP